MNPMWSHGPRCLSTGRETRYPQGFRPIPKIGQGDGMPGDSINRPFAIENELDRLREILPQALGFEDCRHRTMPPIPRRPRTSA